jgi:hypothetical protein
MRNFSRGCRVGLYPVTEILLFGNEGHLQELLPRTFSFKNSPGNRDSAKPYLYIMKFSDQSRVWIYLSNRAFNQAEVSTINQLLQQFCIQWTAHGTNLKAAGEVLHHRFIVLMVDEMAAGASGCSIDKSVHFIQGIEKEFGVQLFNRMIFAWRKKEEIHVSPLSDLQKLFDQGTINANTIVFDTVVTSKKDFDERFQIPFEKSWMMKRIHVKELTP